MAQSSILRNYAHIGRFGMLSFLSNPEGSLPCKSCKAESKQEQLDFAGDQSCVQSPVTNLQLIFFTVTTIFTKP